MEQVADSLDELKSKAAIKTAIKELKEQLALLSPQVMSEKALEPYYDYKRRLQEAVSRECVNGLKPSWKIDVKWNNIDTLTYSFEPSSVAFGLKELEERIEKAEGGGSRVVSPDMFEKRARLSEK